MTYGYAVLLGEITAGWRRKRLIYQLIVGTDYKSSLLVSFGADIASAIIGLLVMPPLG